MNLASRFNQIHSPRSFVAAGALGLLTLAGPAGAVSLCVSTAQELQNDLDAASTGGMYAAQDVEINLVRGTYKTGAATSNGPFKYTSNANGGHLILSGGWGPNCTNFREDASTTTLDGRNATQVLNIQNANADVFVDFLTIQNGESTVAGGGVAINTGVVGGSVYLENNIIRGNHTTSIGGGFAIDGAGSQVSATGNLVTGNSADGGYGAGFEYSRNGNQIFVEQNTMANNTTSASGGTGGMYCCGTPALSPEIYANIFWQNTNFGIDIQGPTPSFEYNDYGTVTGIVTPDSTNLSVNPKFIDPANGNYQLAGSSALLGAYPARPERSTDLAGGGYAFPARGYFDIGAYEDTIFTDHGFGG
jgi:hypothetical protein